MLEIYMQYSISSKGTRSHVVSSIYVLEGFFLFAGHEILIRCGVGFCAKFVVSLIKCRFSCGGCLCADIYFLCPEWLNITLITKLDRSK